jgi:23S rRNA (uridine2552-2'-O)-methyltransferase
MPRRVLHDRYFKQAKADGYAARSAYKLIEIDDKFRLLRPGMAVLDLGCSPGSWLQVASERVASPNAPQGARPGLVVGIDLNPVSIHPPPNVLTLVGDLTKATPEDLTAPNDHRPYDVALSDMAPNTSGHGDHFLSVRLCEAVVDRLPGVLKQGGSLAMKVFEGEALGALLARMRKTFRDVKCFKPDATRDVSREIYIVALGYRPPTATRTNTDKPAPPPAPARPARPPRNWP